MQIPTQHQPTIPQHVLDRLENEWRQIRPVKDQPRTVQLPSSPTASACA